MQNKLLLSFVVAALYFFFQVLVIYSALQLNGACMHSMWLNESVLIPPFWVFTVSVLLIFAYGLVIGFKNFKHRKFGLKEWSFYLTFVVVVILWLKSLHGMWVTFEYEKGNLTANQYYSERQAFYIGPGFQSHSCVQGGN